jgi:thiamine-phosphate pyrophosphorylase
VGLPAFDVMLISDAGPDLPSRVEHVLRDVPPGRVAVQLRRRDLAAGALYELARALRAVTRAHGAWLLVNDRVDVALAAGADGVQLPEGGLAPGLARGLLGTAACIGASRHDASGIAAARDASFVLVSPVFAVPGKGEPLGLDGLRRLVAASPRPVYALGGLDCRHVAGLLSTGARGLATIRAVWDAPDPAAALADLVFAFPAQVVAAPGVQG